MTAFRPLPQEVVALLETVDAPPRLAAHLLVVHDVACQLVDWIEERGLEIDRAAVLFGAATHDIGKVRFPAELSGPGSQHEPAGHELLLEHGIPERLARFARTHASWNDPGIEFEDLVVSLADKVWKGKRVPDLENLVVHRLPGEPWEAFMVLDDVLDWLVVDADVRLAFQTAHPLSR
ncbi:HD domain-containing protein [Kibdelosporangium aridum]|uniref:HD domain-containing protein n=1 Tax=Kibdelosporangium aridum TaxID=2030 RepID=A0A428YTQ3_KIBAR|nr:HD domain-containing protein [Kibdelosporangium aridum]RSM72848.1 HD domain-containing protein [Kibdelosporangium aridum]